MSNLQIDYDSVAEIYDLYVTADYDIPFFLSETAKVEGPVLELTAGTGRLSLPLVQAGVRLTCVDNSQGMLDVLSRKFKETYETGKMDFPQRRPFWLAVHDSSRFC